MANTSMTILSQDLFRISFLVQQAVLQIKVLSSSPLIFLKSFKFNRSYIVFNSFDFWFYDIVEKNICVEAIEAV
jgi:hypothetical protein